MNIEEVEEPETTRITTRNQHQRSWRAERAKKYEFYCENHVKEHPRPTKSTRIATKNEDRRSWRAKKRELPRETRFRPFQEQRRPKKSTRITTKNEHRRSWRAGNHENYHEKPAPDHRRHPKSTRITTKNEHASTKPRKLRRIVSATSDLAPRPFTTTVRTPSVNHTVWGNTTHFSPHTAKKNTIHFTADASHFAQWELWNWYAPCFDSLIYSSTEHSHNHVSDDLDLGWLIHYVSGHRMPKHSKAMGNLKSDSPLIHQMICGLYTR